MLAKKICIKLKVLVKNTPNSESLKIMTLKSFLKNKLKIEKKKPQY